MTKKRKKIIAVDDNATSLAACKNALKAFYEVYPVLSASKMFELIKSVMPDLVLLDVEMPEISGYEAIKILKGDSRLMHIPVIFLTSKNDERSELEGFDLGAADYISKPFSAPLLLKRISKQLSIVQQRMELLASKAIIKDYADSLKTKVREKTAEVINLQKTVLNTVTGLVGFRDRCTGGHVTRTRQYLKVLIDELIREGTYASEITKWDINLFLSSAQLHDVGKIAITDLILNKPGKLTSEEFEIMKTHVSVGVNAIKKIMSSADEHSFLRHTLSIVGAHHEKWDGSGYPMMLTGRDIPLEGRLMAIVDVYDALVSERPYKKPIPHLQAAAIIKKGRGKHFDPLLVDVFSTISDQFLPPI
jgi:putative two-component system response regulator